MTHPLRTTVAAAIVVAIVGMLVGYWARGHWHAPATSTTNGSESQRKALYWYDPMVPAQHFDKPGKSPFMDMQLVPRYADDESAGELSGVRVDPRLTQNLGVRLARVERREVSQSIEAPGTVVFNGRDIAIVQARATGFVSRVYPHAPGDVVSSDAPLVDLAIPEWAAAQSEFLVLIKDGDESLVAAARQRLVLLGMTAAFIGQLESSRQVRSEITVSAPIAGAIDTLDIRAGMTVSPGATLATIKSIDPIWIEAALPETAAPTNGVGGSASVQSTAGADRSFVGRIIGVLPQANADTHTVRVRIELPNHDGFWKPGMFARVRLGRGTHQDALLVPSEAIIHTGTRDLVIVAGADHRFEPVEVSVGEQYGNDTRIIAGLEEGQQVVASGQFLIDSEASLRGAATRMISGADIFRPMDTGGATP